MRTDKRGNYNVIVACICTIGVFNIIAIVLKVYRDCYLHGLLGTLLSALILIAMCT